MLYGHNHEDSEQTQRNNHIKMYRMSTLNKSIYYYYY